MGLRLASKKNFWLMSLQDEASAARVATIHPRDMFLLKAGGAAQAIYYAPGTLGACLGLLHEFRLLKKEWPTCDDARAVFESVQPDSSLYAFESDDRHWRIHNCSLMDFSDPFNRCDWSFFLPQSDGIPLRHEFPAQALAQALTLLPSLNGDYDQPELEGIAAQNRWCAELLERLDMFGALVDVDTPAPLNLATLPPLLFLNHASIMLHDGSNSVVIDPVFIDNAAALNGPARDPYWLTAQADAVLFSHHHWDHFHYTTLARIPRDKLIVVPRTTTATPMNPPMKSYLEAMAFTHVREYQPGESLTVGDIHVRLFPFYGEAFGRDSEFDAFTYHVEFAGKTLFGSVDAWRNESASMEAVIDQVAELGPLDFFLFGSSGQHHSPGFLAAAPRHLSNELVDMPDLLRYHPNVHDVARWAAVLSPGVLIPYAQFIFIGSQQADITLDAVGKTGTVNEYWDEISKLLRVNSAIREWEQDIRWLSTQTRHPIQLLHPLQGIDFATKGQA